MGSYGTVGMMGCGKLGGPVLLALESRGVPMLGCDIGRMMIDARKRDSWPHREDQVNQLLRTAHFRMVPASKLVEKCSLIFVAVQTPHGEGLDGSAPVDPDEYTDFDYEPLRAALTELREHCAKYEYEDQPLIVTISTCLPGTYQREFADMMAGQKYAYNPAFVAMGQVVEDFLDPEFVLIGSEPHVDLRPLTELYDHTLRRWHPIITDITTAELTKMAYNQIIGQKIVWANTVMEIAHKTGADVDVVTEAMRKADRRIASAAYLSGGMGDGGACHPRDGMALSHLAKQLHLSHDIFADTLAARLAQSRWLARMTVDLEKTHDEVDGVVVLGRAYKPGTDLTVGSAAALLAHDIHELGVQPFVYDPYVDGYTQKPHDDPPSVFVVATRHIEFRSYKFPPGSIVIDPFRFVPATKDVQVISIGGRTPDH